MSKLYTLEELKFLNIKPLFLENFHPDDRFDGGGEKVIEIDIPANHYPNNRFSLPIVSSEIKCNQCGSTKFIVGKGIYFTAIKCETCGWEKCVHEG